MLHDVDILTQIQVLCRARLASCLTSQKNGKASSVSAGQQKAVLWTIWGLGARSRDDLSEYVGNSDGTTGRAIKALNGAGILKSSRGVHASRKSGPGGSLPYVHVICWERLIQLVPPNELQHLTEQREARESLPERVSLSALGWATQGALNPTRVSKTRGTMVGEGV